MDDDIELQATDINIFPTVITKGNIPNSIYDKNVIMDAVMDNLDDNNQTMDFLGNGAFIHHDQRLSKLYEIIVEYVKYHLSLFAIHPDTYQIHVVKSWFNVSGKANRNSIHNHNEADYSVTFYPQVPANSKKWLRLLRPAHHTTNEIFPGQWVNWCAEKNGLNGNEWATIPEEGDLYIFPASILHDTVNEDLSESSDSVAVVNSREDLVNMRICIGVDIKLTSKHRTQNYKILQPVDTWRTFG